MNLNPRLKLKKVVQSRREASEYLQSPGDAVLVERGVPRWLLLSCPCGCGAELPINLDSRAGKAWRLYRQPKAGISVFPSVWRDTDCGSHFVIWRDSILLFGRADEDFSSPARAEEIAALGETAQQHLPPFGFVHFVDVADSLGDVPWDVLDGLRYLVRKGIAREGTGKDRGNFCRVTETGSTSRGLT
jgi:hypothetical protein